MIGDLLTPPGIIEILKRIVTTTLYLFEECIVEMILHELDGQEFAIHIVGENLRIVHRVYVLRPRIAWCFRPTCMTGSFMTLLKISYDSFAEGAFKSLVVLYVDSTHFLLYFLRPTPSRIEGMIPRY